MGRFGKYYIVKIWLLTVVLGSVLSTIVFSLYYWNISHFFGFIFSQIIYGLVLCLPSFILAECFYLFYSKSNLQDKKVFVGTMIISFMLTLTTYYVFLGVFSESYNYLPIFSISYSMVLIFGFVYFRKPYFK